MVKKPSRKQSSPKKPKQKPQTKRIGLWRLRTFDIAAFVIAKSLLSAGVEKVINLL